MRFYKGQMIPPYILRNSNPVNQHLATFGQDVEAVRVPDKGFYLHPVGVPGDCVVHLRGDNQTWIGAPCSVIGFNSRNTIE